MNLTLEQDFYNLLKQHAEKDFMLISTWTKQFLKKNLLTNYKDVKKQTENEHAL